MTVKPSMLDVELGGALLKRTLTVLLNKMKEDNPDSNWSGDWDDLHIVEAGCGKASSYHIRYGEGGTEPSHYVLSVEYVTELRCLRWVNVKFPVVSANNVSQLNEKDITDSTTLVMFHHLLSVLGTLKFFTHLDNPETSNLN